MARYLVIHSPIDSDDTTARKPTEMLELARRCGEEGASPRWIRSWSPDLHDDRIFTLWDARNAADITAALSQYGFLDHMHAQALRVQEWGPHDVLAAEGEPAHDDA